MFRWILPLFLAATLAGGAAAADLPAPEGRVILTVSGNIGVTNAGDEARFDRALLKSVGWRTIETYTAWTEGRQEFSGVPLAALMERLEADGETLRAHALNDYEAVIPMRDLAEHDVLLAADQDGEPMPIRSRGPLWIVYPNDAPSSKSSPANEKMVWQLDEIVVE